MAISGTQLKFFPIATVLLLLIIAIPVDAAKIELSGGLFSFTATNSRNGTAATLSNIGSYHFAYKYPLLQKFELDAGYSLIATKGIGGDLAFGFDVGFNYFPVSYADDVRFENPKIKVSANYDWKPFVGFAFHQRNFQSSSSQYAGWGFKVGAEKSWTPQLQWIGALRYGALVGPNQSKASQTELLIGGIFNFW